MARALNCVLCLVASALSGDVRESQSLVQVRGIEQGPDDSTGFYAAAVGSGSGLKTMVKVPVLSEEKAWPNLATTKDMPGVPRKKDGDTLVNACQAIQEQSTGLTQANSSAVASSVSCSTEFSANHKVGTKHHVEMVIARCKEELDWLPELIEDGLLDSVYIYEKCDSQNHKFGKNATMKFGDYAVQVHSVQLANVGKEGLAYLHHMLHVVDVGQSKADAVVFVQGELEWKAKNFGQAIRACREDGVCLAVSVMARAQRGFYLGKKEDAIICTCIEALSGQKCTPKGQDKPEMYVTARGEFLTTASNIKRMMSGKWRQIAEAFYESMAKNMNPVEGHILERFWGMLLQGDDFDFHSSALIC